MTNDLSSSSKPPVAFTQEIRFAVVMYGGSSLCIYMNGVAQELLRLVRATAPDPSNENVAYHPDGSDKLGGSGQIYRKLGQMLSRGDNSCHLPEDRTLRTRFVIDVLSGTSAGGINAVYLAKALANDQDLEELKKLWVETADINVLMNDSQSPAKKLLASQKQPRSLLNSRLMYYMLLDALGHMDSQNGSAQRRAANSPYVDELDLYVTATDMVGRKIRLRLADGIARERRHLNTFHFNYSAERLTGERKNQFTAQYNPFLAFAARCTSAHPVPFEPVTLSDIDEALEKLNLNARSGNEDWQTFYEEYLQPYVDPTAPRQTDGDPAKTRARLADEFRRRPFNDGGVLDNSPFSFVIDALQFRHSDLPVDRKLLYVEPVPEHPEEEVDSLDKPDAFATGWLSLSVLPRYQFIREDLERILDRNRLIERVKRILQGVERDERDRLGKQRIEEARRRREATRRSSQTPVGEQATTAKGSDSISEDEAQEPLTSFQFGQKNLREMIRLMGSSWGGYQRLRVAETTDELVMMISQAAGFDEESDEFLSIRYLVRTWRSQNYDAYGEGTKGRMSNEGWKPDDADPTANKDTENQFLYKYDLKWRVRRLKFVLNKVDEISCFDKRTKEMLSIAEHLETTARLGDGDASLLVEQLAAQPEFQKELRTIKREIGSLLRGLLVERRRLLSRAASGQKTGATADETGNPLAPSIKSLGISPSDILAILELPTDKGRETKAEEILVGKGAQFKSFSDVLDKTLSRIMIDASARVKGDSQYQGQGILELSEPQMGDSAPAASGKLMARAILRYYYDNFDRYEMISYPILYATNVGEEVDTVEVFRISPEDARHLVTDPAARRRKLAGTSLGNFGAFFDTEFRRNDILWGRLDAAERIITALLSSIPAEDAPARARLESELIMDAQRAILAEEFRAEDKAGLRSLLGAALAETKSEADNETFRQRLNERLKVNPPDLLKVQAFLNACLQGTDPLIHFRDTYNYEHPLEPKVLVRLSARASKVFGKMLEGFADKQHFDKKRVVWVTRLAQLFWGLVEVAVPDSLWNLIFRHWVKLLYVFEGLIIFGATLLLNKPIQQFGLTAFGITAAVHIAALLLEDAMVSPKPIPVCTCIGTVGVSKHQSETAIFSANANANGNNKRSLRRIFAFVLFTVLLVPLGFGVIFLLGVMGFEFSLNIVQKAVAPDPPGWNLKTVLRVLMLFPVLYAFLWALVSGFREYRRPKQE